MFPRYLLFVFYNRVACCKEPVLWKVMHHASDNTWIETVCLSLFFFYRDILLGIYYAMNTLWL